MELELVRTGATLHDDHSVQFGSYSVYAFERKRFCWSELASKRESELIGFCFWGDGNERKEKS